MPSCRSDLPCRAPCQWRRVAGRSLAAGGAGLAGTGVAWVVMGSALRDGEGLIEVVVLAAVLFGVGSLRTPRAGSADVQAPRGYREGTGSSPPPWVPAPLRRPVGRRPVGPVARVDAEAVGEDGQDHQGDEPAVAAACQALLAWWAGREGAGQRPGTAARRGCTATRRRWRRARRARRAWSASRCGWSIRGCASRAAAGRPRRAGPAGSGACGGASRRPSRPAWRRPFDLGG